jgi:hypothetical protein
MSLRLAGPTLASPEQALPGHDTAADIGLQQSLGHQQAAPIYSTDTRVPQALVDKAHGAIAPGLEGLYSPKELQDISYGLARHSLEEDAHKGPVQGFLVAKDRRSVAIKYEHQFTQVQLPEPEQGAATTTAPSTSRTVQIQPGVYKHTDAQGRTTYSSSPDAPLSPKEQEIYTQERAQREQSMRAEHALHNHHNRQEILQRFTQQAVLSSELKEQEAQAQAALAQRQGWGGVVRGGQETITDTLKSPYYVYQSVKTHGVEGTLTNAAQATLELPEQVMKAVEQGDMQTLTGAALGVIPLTRGGKLAAVVDVPEVKGAGRSLLHELQVGSDGRANSAIGAKLVEQLAQESLAASGANMGNIKVVATGKINGQNYIDTNQTARSTTAANALEITLVPADRVAAREAQGLGNVNGNMATAHAELGVIQQAFNAGVTKGADMTITVKGKAVCDFCRGDIPPAAEAAGLKSLTIIDQEAGATYYWRSGMKTLRER